MKVRFTAELDASLTDSDVRQFAQNVLKGLPEYFWVVPASSSGKYHPEYTLGEGGLARHSLATFIIAKDLLGHPIFGASFTDRQKQLLLVAALFHDGRKSGEQTDYEAAANTKFEHPIWMANAVLATEGLCDEERQYIADAICSHMGPWTTSKYSEVQLVSPSSPAQLIVHLADYEASRKFLEVKF